jgi:hypothetical protein
MSKTGLFLLENFKNIPIEIQVKQDYEWLNYSDSSLMNKVVISAVLIDYDEDSGVITLRSPASNKIFYLPEDHIEMFWEAGFNVLECINTSLNGGNRMKKKKNRDIM